MPSSAEKQISARTAPSRRRYGLKRRDAAKVRAADGGVGRALGLLAGSHVPTLAARSGLNEPRYGATSKLNIIPLSWCSAM